MNETQPRVLIVDDDDDNLFLFSTILRKTGFNVKTAVSPPSALSLLKNESFNLVITDYCMPDMDGITFIETLRSFQSSDQSKTPVLMMSALKFNDQQKMRCQKSDIHLLEKPFNHNDLAAKAINIVKHE